MTVARSRLRIAAWFRLNVLTYNLLSVLRRTALPKELERAPRGFPCFQKLRKPGTTLPHRRPPLDLIERLGLRPAT